jgi:hypothetical protein
MLPMRTCRLASRSKSYDPLLDVRPEACVWLSLQFETFYTWPTELRLFFTILLNREGSILAEDYFFIPLPSTVGSNLVLYFFSCWSYFTYLFALF